MIENAHKKLEAWAHAHPGASIGVDERWRVIGDAAAEVGPALFFSLLIITLSFVPVFTLEAQEGRMFAPIAYTKTYAMVWASLLSITLVPVLIYWLVRGRIRPESANPVNRATAAAYRPFLGLALRAPWAVTGVATILVLATSWLASRLGTEFMPELDEGDFLYMPTTLPGLSTDAARALLQQTDKLIRTVPEVERVFGKAGRAESATDPAPIEMFETTIMLKPRDQWRPGMTPEKLKAELDALVKFPEFRTSGHIRSRRASTCSRPVSAHRSESRSWGRTSAPSSNSAARSRTSCARCPVRSRCMPSGLQPAATSTWTSTGSRRPAMASTSRTCRTSSAARWAA
jgi:Cu(I)/Ag(I) efflux system membrane protein CusA/SilA